MSEESVQVSYANGFEPLVDLLTSVQHPGDYFISGTAETPLPTLKIAGVGTVAFPVPPKQARALIKAAAERAPYGRGDRTLVDETVRKVWQISPDKVSLTGRGWEATFKGIIGKVAEGLGCDGKSVHAEFYKLLIYDKGGFFVAHRDSEKAGGMFGTLVISLPSEHTGGELTIRHAGREATIDLSVNEPGEVRFAAFYADCEHEVSPISSGFRVCLIYNLVARKAKGAKPVAPPDSRMVVPRVAELLAKWVENDSDPQKLVYLLDHHYTQASLSFAALKGRDVNLARVLKAAAMQAGCCCYIGMVHIEESGWAEFCGDYYGRRGRWNDEEETNGDDYQVGEVCEANYYIDHWRDTDGGEVEFGVIPLLENTLLPPGALDDEEPDEKHFSEATGNAGASFERTYLRAAVILWPAYRTDEVLISGGIDGAIARLGQLVSESRRGAAADKAAAKESVRRIAKMILERWGERSSQGGRLRWFLEALVKFGDADLLAKTVVPLIVKNYTGGQNGVLVDAIELLGQTRGMQIFDELIQSRGSEYPGSSMDLWIRLASTKDSSAIAHGLLDKLAQKLAEGPSSIRSGRYLIGDDDVRPVELTPALIAKFLKAVEKRETSEGVRVVVRAMIGNPEVFTIENHLLPALERTNKKQHSIDKEAYDCIWNHCGTYFLSRSPHPPKQPEDWAQAVTVPGRTPELRELERFARDPVAREYRFRTNEAVRQGIESTIRMLNLDMDCTTERKSRPYSLVCVKTRASYERSCERYRRDIAQMRKLLELGAAGSPGIKTLMSRLKNAIDASGL